MLNFHLFISSFVSLHKVVQKKVADKFEQNDEA